jgi:eukaryotic-like serine/threonine-protein kinase
MSTSTPVLAAGTILHETYEVVRRVGAGGMGEVYEARHARLPGRFAVKVLAARVAAGSPEFRRFRREAEIASTLRHPNLVQVVDFNLMADGSPYLVMEFLEGTDLHEELQRVLRIPPARTASIVGQVAAALAQAHAGGVVHRDLKPQNVFLVPMRGRDSDFVKVVDFGISKVKSAATVTTEPTLMGTPQYMSPEQAHGRTAEVDAHTDQFALAAMSYEMLCGRPAFSGDSVPAILFEIANKDPSPLGMPALDEEVEVVLRRGLAKTRAGRFPTILEFADALERSLVGPGRREMRTPGRGSHAPAVATRPYAVVTAPETGTLPPAVSTVRPRRWPPSARWGLILVAVALPAAAAVGLFQARARRPPATPAAAPAVAPARSPRAEVTPLPRPLPPASPPVGQASAQSGAVQPAPPPQSSPPPQATRPPGRTRTSEAARTRPRGDRKRDRDAAGPPQRNKIPFIQKL